MLTGILVIAGFYGLFVLIGIQSRKPWWVGKR